MLKRHIGLCLFFFYSLSAHALVELSANYSYEKQVYGNTGSNNILDKEYSGTFALYLFEYTAIEFGAASGTEILTEKERVSNPSYAITCDITRIKTKTYNVGFRQAFASTKSRFIPLLSLGYAKQFIRSTRQTTIEVSGTEIVLDEQRSKRRTDNVFASFSLKLKLTRMFFIQSSVSTVFKAFEFSQAKNFLRYRVGFSWYF